MTAKPKIAILGDAASLHLRNWVLPFVDEFEVHLLSVEENKVGSEVHWYPLKRYFEPHLPFLLNVGRLNQILARLKPDVLHVHYATSYGYLGARAKVDCPKMLTAWGSDVAVAPQRSALIRQLLRWSLKSYAWINVPAQHIREKLLALGVPPRKIAVFMYGIDADRLTLKSPAQGPSFRLLSLRSWDSLYRVDEILDGFELYCDRHADVKLVIVGGGPADDERRIRARVAEARHPQRFDLIGKVPHDQLLSIMPTCDMAISIPKSDGTPMSLLETMGIGLLPIVSDIEANREWVSPPNCVMLNRFDPSSIAGAIERAVNILRAGYTGQESRALVVERGNYAKNMARLLAVYRSLVQEG
jgi:glycosyltransferase involved in cell wall biosynthesis